MSLRITIDEKCQGHGRCYEICPDLFEPDVEGYAKVRDVAVGDGSPLAELVRKAVIGCPERAISVDG